MTALTCHVWRCIVDVEGVVVLSCVGIEGSECLELKSGVILLFLGLVFLHEGKIGVVEFSE